MKLLLRLVGTISLLAAIGLATSWNQRRQLPYNSQGRYFDTEQSVVLHEQAVAFFGFASLGFALLGIACWFLAVRNRR